MKKIGIVGTGPALAAALEKLKETNSEWAVVVLDENDPVFKTKLTGLKPESEELFDLSSMPPLKIKDPPMIFEEREMHNRTYTSDEYQNRSGKRAKINKNRKRRW